MTASLRGALTLLVLLNLVFVQLTDAVALHWLVAMQVLTAASPLCVRFQERTSWRLCWNLGVLAIFGVLVRDTATSGPRHLLEDGLILAAFCQVHLLNVLRAKQKPDLLFFNSFLIALVTSFFCQDLAFSLTFIVYAFVFVAALELAADRGRLAPKVVVRGSVRHSVALVGVTMAVFALAPRDFRREGLVDEHAFGGFAASSSGFHDRVDLGRSAHTTVSERVVMRVRVAPEHRDAVPALWRGAVLERYEARGWRTVHRLRQDDPVSLRWSPSGIGRWSREGEPVAHAVVERSDDGYGVLFTPLEAVEIGVPADARPEAVYPRTDGTFARQRPSRSRDTAWSYTVALGDDAPRVGAAVRERLAPFLHLEADRHEAVPPVAHDLLRDALRGLPEGASQAEVVEHCRACIETRFDYLLPGRQGAATGLSDFLNGRGGGHCELFATSLAILLRLRGVPCRIATGYLVDEWNAGQQAFIVRQRHAHAWVEVYDAQRQVWYAVDATPPAEEAAEEGEGPWAAVAAPFRDLWRAVTTFDAEARDRLLRGVLDLPAATLRAAVARPVAAAFVAAAVVLALVAWFRRRRRRLADPVVHYERMLRRLRILRAPTETPRELLHRVAAMQGLAAGALAQLEAATSRHETARFATPQRFPVA